MILSLLAICLVFSLSPSVAATSNGTQRSVLSPQYAEFPTNQTVEYGTRMRYQLEIVSAEEIFAWYISDTINFHISINGLLKDTHVLDIGVYPLFIRVWDWQYSHTDAMIYIHVVDSMFPEISTPEDIEFTKGETGNKIVWEVRESNPLSFEIRKSGMVIRQGGMTESIETFEVNLDNYVPGTYVFTLTVTDLGGNVAEDEVIVHIRQDLDAEEPESTVLEYIEESKPRNRAIGTPTPFVDYQRVFATIVFGGLSAMVMIAFLSSRRQSFGFG
jgi:hypothetical protein